MAGPQHGYALYQAFTREFGQIWKAGQTKFYVTLTALESDGYVSSTTEPQPNRPDRKVYHLTDAGRALFLGWLHRPVTSMRAVRVELIAKLRFFGLLGLPGAGTLIDAQSAVFQSMLAEWEQPPPPETPVDPFYSLVADFRIRQARFIIEWLAAHRGTFKE
jgi:DNA-binding PadR family transcriptional regulator